MKFVPLAGPLMLMLAGIVVGQPCVTIPLDTLVGVVEPSQFVYIPTTGEVVVAGYSTGGYARVLGFDATTLTKTWSGYVPNGVSGMIYSPLSGSFYCAVSASVAVFDPVRRRIKNLIYLGATEGVFAGLPSVGEIYYSEPYLSRVAVFDARADTLKRTVDVPLMPRAMCADPQGDRLFICSSVDHRVVIMDVRTDSILASLSVVTEPRALAYSASLNKLYCACRASGTVAVIDCSTYRLTRTITVGEQPVALHFDATSAKLYVATYGTTTVVNCASDSVVATIPGGTPACFVGHPDLVRLYCPIAFGNTVSVIDIPGDSVQSTITVGSRPVGAFYDTVGDRLLVGVGSTSQVDVVDCARDSVVASHPTDGTGPLGVACDTGCGTVFTTRRPNLLTAVLAEPLGQIRSVAVGDHPTAVQFSASKGVAYCANTGLLRPDSTISVVDAATLTVVDTIVVGRSPQSLCLVEDMRRLYCALAPNGVADDSIFIIDIDSGDVVRSVPIPEEPTGLIFIEQLRKLYVTTAASRLLVLPIDSISCIRTVALPLQCGKAVVYNSEHNKVYCGILHGVVVIDPVRDSLSGEIPLDLQYPLLAYCQTGERLYCVALQFGGWTPLCVVVDGATDRVILQFELTGCEFPNTVCYSSGSARVYCTNNSSTGMVHVIDGPTSVVLGRPAVDRYPRQIMVNSFNDLVYVANYRGGSLSVFPDYGPVGLDEPRHRNEHGAVPSVLNGVVDIGEGTAGVVVDVAGRNVWKLTEGRNDLSRLPGGVYFLRTNRGSINMTTRKVVIRR